MYTRVVPFCKGVGQSPVKHPRSKAEARFYSVKVAKNGSSL
jgi:hypothetical protein